MTARSALADIWPLFGLRVVGPRLTLQLAVGEEVAALALEARSLNAPGEPQFQMRWMYDPSPLMEREFLRRYWKALSAWDSNEWRLPLVAYLNGKPIGLQDVWAEDFVVARTVRTGSWIGRGYQGQGLGTEMRAAALELAFGCLQVAEAYTDFYAENARSAAVSRKLGYVDNGQRVVSRRGQPAVERLMRLDRVSWERCRLSGVKVEGVADCLELFGLSR